LAHAIYDFYNLNAGHKGIVNNGWKWYENMAQDHLGQSDSVRSALAAGSFLILLRLDDFAERRRLLLALRFGLRL